ncbi:MAG: A/G-specific adenine glycosylase [Oscillospiraceae bacterium]|nr:A/G-specific adenine glycosylase [Oscillospiraceae bacterium]
MSETNVFFPVLFRDIPPREAVSALLDWYRASARELPWRTQITPYRVWISEIMLQQTRVEAVKPYFHRFLEALPDIPSLADVDDARLLKLWEGLGYYSRARNLKKAANVLMEQYGGELPADVQKLKKLPGIGSYTAGAIASIAFGIPAPAVDGNVLRVLARLTGCDADILRPQTRAAAEQAALQLCPADTPGDFTQGMIELGATVCVPNGEAKCSVCPFSPWCVAAREGMVDRLPVRSAKAPRRVEDRTVLLLREGDRYLIRRRPPKGLLAGLYELPNELGTLNREEAIAFARKNGFQPLRTEHLSPATHIFTHVEWHMTAYLMTGYFSETETEGEERIMASREELSAVYAVPSAFSAYLKAILELETP